MQLYLKDKIFFRVGKQFNDFFLSFAPKIRLFKEYGKRVQRNFLVCLRYVQQRSASSGPEVNFGGPDCCRGSRGGRKIVGPASPFMNISWVLFHKVVPKIAQGRENVFEFSVLVQEINRIFQCKLMNLQRHWSPKKVIWFITFFALKFFPIALTQSTIAMNVTCA